MLYFLFLTIQLSVHAVLEIRDDANPKCTPGTSVGTFILDAPNRTSILLVSQPFMIQWHYTPPVKNPPKSLDIKLQLVQDGVTYSWSTLVVKDLNISNGATAFNWTVQPLNDGEYKIRLVPDGKETFNVKNDQLPCFSDGEALPANSGQFKVINTIPLATSRDALPPNLSKGHSLDNRVAIFLLMIVMHVLFSKE